MPVPTTPLAHPTSAGEAARERTLTQLDHARLSRLLEHHGKLCEELNDTLDLSDLVDPRDIGTDVVTMNSRVLLVDEGTGQQQELTLSYPDQAQAGEGRVSVMSPVGASLLGARVGTTVQWSPPGGAPRRTRVLSLIYQPEAAGDFLR